MLCHSLPDERVLHQVIGYVLEQNRQRIAKSAVWVDRRGLSIVLAQLEELLEMLLSFLTGECRWVVASL